MKRTAKRKAFVFSLEALLSLLAAVALLAFVSVSTPQQDLGLDSLARNALAQDLLETGLKDKASARLLYAFAAGDASAKETLKTQWSELLRGAGTNCFKLDAGSRTLETKCASDKKFAVTAERALFDGTRWTNARLTLYFAS
jgi:hypothetical protein